MATPSLVDLPDEILHTILCYASASSATALEQTSSRFRNVANAHLLWRHYCQADFTFWDARHHIGHKLAAPPAAVRWKDVYKTRRLIDRATTRLLDSILASQTGRIEKVHQIIGFGYDAKDTLLRHARAREEETEDYLARRYYSNAILGCLHRALAIPEWQRLKDGADVPIHRALGVFDLLVLETGRGDFDDISAVLDEMVQGILDERPDILARTPRARAVSIAEYLRSKNLLGIEPGREYYRIEHNFLGVALLDEGHNSLPLISAAIYCYVAQKLGLNANPCGFPFHVHVIIRPERGYDLDQRPLDDAAQEGEPMYMDPFRSTAETPVSELQSQLDYLGALTLSRSTYLRASRVPEIVLRCAKNILNAMLQTPHNRDTSLDLARVKYAALWAAMLFEEDPNAENAATLGAHQAQPFGHRLRRYLPSFMELFATYFPLDVFLVEQHIIPLFRGLPEYAHLLESIHAMKAGDQFPKQVHRRTWEHRNVRYRVGQVFRHRRYAYTAVITGWDAECGAEEDWMQTMGVDRLPRGRHQSFYHALVEDKSVRYVAEENIQIIHPPLSSLPSVLVNLAGKYFKRWDHESRRFVSNIRDEYPDD
ncbi:hypothetical protein VTO42DRAFT_4339 [Malbranchea cinnamomea]